MNTYASSMRSRVSYRFQINSLFMCGRAKTLKLRFQTNTDTSGQGLEIALTSIV